MWGSWFMVAGLVCVAYGLWFIFWEFGVWGLGFGVLGLGFGVWGLGFGVWGLGLRVWGAWFRVGVEGRFRYHF